MVAAQLKLGQNERALRDANRCIDCNPWWVKGYIRLAEVHRAMSHHGLALDVLNDKVLAIDPENKNADRLIEEILQESQEQNSAKLAMSPRRQ